MTDVAVPGDPFGLTGSTLAGRYHVEGRIGEGGFAVVYRAYQAVLDRFVALKVLKTPPGLDAAAQANFRERFASEARTIARLKHPYVVSVYDFGVDRMASGELAPWMALEWLDGETLETDLDRRRGAGGRSSAEAVSLLRPVIDALAYAHRQGIVHRDVKPANMMIVPAETGHVVRMLDFGIAKIMRAGQGDTTKRTGMSAVPAFSPHYAAPEQVTFSRTGPWTDVHALGLVLTETLTDQPPYSDEGDAHLFERAMDSTRPTPRSKGKNVGRLEKVIEKAVRLSPRLRWQNAGELLQAIDSVSLIRESRRPVRERSPVATVERRATAPARRPLPSRVVNRIVVSVGGAAILVAFSVIAWTLRSDRPAVSVSDEFAVTRSMTGPTRRQVPRTVTSPWIVSIMPSPAAASPVAKSAEPPLERRPRPASSSERGREGQSPKAGTGAWTHWVDPFDDSVGVASESCRMTVNSVPWSEVWIDGGNTGRHTPLVDFRVACGHHQIEFKRPDLRIDQAESVMIDPTKTFKQRYSLVTGSE